MSKDYDGPETFKKKFDAYLSLMKETVSIYDGADDEDHDRMINEAWRLSKEKLLPVLELAKYKWQCEHILKAVGYIDSEVVQKILAKTKTLPDKTFDDYINDYKSANPLDRAKEFSELEDAAVTVELVLKLFDIKYLEKCEEYNHSDQDRLMGEDCDNLRLKYALAALELATTEKECQEICKILLERNTYIRHIIDEKIKNLSKLI